MKKLYLNYYNQIVILNIFKKVDNLFQNKQSMQNQIDKSQEVIKNFKTNQSSKIAASVLISSF